MQQSCFYRDPNDSACEIEYELEPKAASRAFILKFDQDHCQLNGQISSGALCLTA